MEFGRAERRVPPLSFLPTVLQRQTENMDTILAMYRPVRPVTAITAQTSQYLSLDRKQRTTVFLRLSLDGKDSAIVVIFTEPFDLPDYLAYTIFAVAIKAIYRSHGSIDTKRISPKVDTALGRSCSQITVDVPLALAETRLLSLPQSW